MKYGNRSVLRRVLSSRITLVLLLFVLVVMARACWNIYQKSAASSVKLSEADAELAAMRSHQADLESQVAYLSTDAGVEAELRTKYRAVQNGESVAVIIGDQSDGDANASASPDVASVAAVDASSTAALGWWGRLLQVVGF